METVRGDRFDRHELYPEDWNGREQSGDDDIETYNHLNHSKFIRNDREDWEIRNSLWKPG